MLRVEWANGVVSEFASLWLRDNLRQDRDPHSGQRLTDITDVPTDPVIRSAVTGGGRVLVEWEHERQPASFDLDWLAAHAPGSRPPWPELVTRPWLEGATLDAERDFAWLALAEARSNPTVRVDWLTRLLQDGIAFLSGVPPQHEALTEAMSLVGRVFETNYGSVFDVRSVPQPENLAYSDLGLGLHTDNPYREPVPGFQALHVLIASREGGQSLFADGRALAEHVRRTAPDVFTQLTQTPAPFLYRSSDTELYAERPVIQLSCRGDVSAVHYNSRSIAPLRLPAGDVTRFYAAYRHFAGLLRDQRFHLKLGLRDGDLVVFDNQRILHGRTGFSSARYPRHLRGCYLTRDSVYCQTALLRRSLDPEARK
jgi:alpha-ketoglutarate-dependent taurine dioxygenase